MKDEQKEFDRLLKRFDEQMAKFFKKANRYMRLLGEMQGEIKQRQEKQQQRDK